MQDASVVVGVAGHGGEGTLRGLKGDCFCGAQPAFVVLITLALRGVLELDQALAAVDPVGLAALFGRCVRDGLLLDAAQQVVKVGSPVALGVRAGYQSVGYLNESPP